MKGLIEGNNPQPAGAPAEPAGAAPSGEESAMPEDANSEQPTPEEQEAYSRVEAAAMEIVFGEKTSEPILQQLQTGADNPGEVLGETAMMVFSQIDEKSGGKIPESVMLQGALKVLDFLVELGEKAGVFQVDEPVQKMAVQQMLISASEMGYISEQDIGELQAMIESMPEEEVQSIVTEQSQLGGPPNG